MQIRLPLERTRDTALYYPLREQMGIKREGQYPALRIIAKKVLDKEIQEKGKGGHDPVRGPLMVQTKHRPDITKSQVRGCFYGIVDIHGLQGSMGSCP